MKHLVFLLFLLPETIVQAQRSVEIDFINKELKLDNKSIYIFCRGTKSKSKLIAEKFNKADRNITHVGIGVVHDGKLHLYNVTDGVNSHESALVIDSLESFIILSDVYYMSIWKCNLTIKEFKKGARLGESYAGRKIFFDASFNISNDDTLYCSEFCALFLKEINFNKFDFKPEFIELNNKLMESVLGRQYLSYFPVDFFQSNRHFNKVFEYRFRN